MALTMTVITNSPVTNEQETITVTDINPELFPTSGTIPMTSYQAADNVGRKLTALSQNTYVDTVITRSESVTEILIDG